MGLDQCAYTRTKNDAPEDVVPQFIWRKHAKLQEFMEALFVRRTGKNAVDLNCGELELTAEDIAELKRLVGNKALPKSSGGFFYGHQFQEENAKHFRDQDLDFCKWALSTLTTGKSVYYSCWW